MPKIQIMDDNYDFYEDWMKWWFPTYKKHVQEAKFENNTEALKAIYWNVKKNWHLVGYKFYILEKLGIKYLEQMNLTIEDENVKSIDPEIISIYFKHKRKKEKYENTN